MSRASSDFNISADREREVIHDHWVLFLIQGIMLAALGLLAIGAPFLATVVVRRETRRVAVPHRRHCRFGQPVYRPSGAWLFLEFLERNRLNPRRNLYSLSAACRHVVAYARACGFFLRAGDHPDLRIALS